MAKNYGKAALLFTESIGGTEEEDSYDVVGRDYGATFKTEAESMNQTLTKLCSIEQRWRWIAEVYGPEKAWVKRNEWCDDGLPVVRLIIEDGDKRCLREVYVVGVE